MVAGTMTRASRSGALLAGCVAASLHRAVASAELTLQREIRNSNDVAAFYAAFEGEAPFFGAWAIDGDFARLLVREVETAQIIVECGSGVSTLLIARTLETRGDGTLFSIENDCDELERTRARLESNGLEARVRLIHAPITEQRFGVETVSWYDLEALAPLHGQPVDLLVVDGPRTYDRRSRWPAMEVFGEQLSPAASVLLDDGRRREERWIAKRWRSAHGEFTLYWVDTVKGTWKLVRRSDGGASRTSYLWRTALRTVNPAPPGFALSPVRR